MGWQDAPAVQTGAARPMWASAPAVNDEFAAQAASMAPDDLSVARTKNNAFGEYLRKQAMQPREGESDADRQQRLYGSLPQQDVGAGEGALRGYFQGGTYGGGDEVVAGAAAVLDPLIHGDQGKDLGERYGAYLARERGKIDRFRDTNPALAYGSEIAGAIPTALMAPGIGVDAGAGVVTRAGASALEGMGHGAVYGFNAGEGSDRIKSALIGGGIGGGIGAAAPAVAAGGRALYNRMATNSAARDIGMSRPAYDIMQTVSQADDSLTGAGAQRVHAAGPGAMLADAGPSQRALFDVATQRTGPGARIATERVQARTDAAAQHLTTTLDDVLGAPQGVRSVARNIAQSTSGARGNAYDAAYAVPINYADDAGRAIESTLDRIPPRIKSQAIEDANEMMWANGERNNQIMFTVADDGSVAMQEMPNVMQLDYIKRALGEMSADAMGDFGRKTGKGNMLGDLARDLRDAVKAAVPGYGDALRLGQDKIARDRALQLGRDLLQSRTTRETVADAVEGMSDEARQAALLGVRGHIDDALANVKRTVADGDTTAREAVKLIKDMSSRANREKVAAVAGDDAARQLFSELDQAAMAFDLRAGMAQNSKTFARGALNDTVEGSVNAGPLAAIREGEPVTAAKNMVQALLGGGPEAKKKITDKVVMEMVDALTGPDPMRRLQLMATVPGQISARTNAFGRTLESITRRNAPVSERMRDALMSTR